ncbi:DUF2062 domain-containing protein [Haloferula chungangensis]|uniref:DUF2062 domain-containing protein n=1 Tax=Haloferula chungangensis TaxID=1048331 RepID=A0ABW2L9F9_9BACT
MRKVHRLLRHRRLRHRGWWKPILHQLLDRRLWHPCRDTVAGGISIGLFFSMMPMPFQSLAAAAIATRAKVNIPFTIAACFVTNPLTEIPIRAAQLGFGAWLRETFGITVPRIADASLPEGFSNFIIGFLMMGVLLSLIAYPLVHLFSALLPHHLPIKRHRVRPPREPARRGSAN